MKICKVLFSDAYIRVDDNKWRISQNFIKLIGSSWRIKKKTVERKELEIKIVSRN